MARQDNNLEEQDSTLEEQENASSDKRTKKMKLRYKVILALLLLVICLAGYVYRYYGDRSGDSYKKEKGNDKQLIDVDGNISDGSLDIDSSDKPVAQGLRCIVSSAPYYKSTSSMGNLSIANHKDNEGYLLQVEITDEKTGKVFYISPALKPDEKIQEDYLKNQDFKKGSYSAIATFNFYTVEDESFYYAVPIRIKMNID